MRPYFVLPLVLFVAACATPAPAATPDSATVFCSADVKNCPGGATVSRDPANNCEFAACPLTTPSSMTTLTPLPLASLPAATLTDAKLPQLHAPKVGDTVAKIVTDSGDIWVRLFTLDAPATTTNFIGLAQKKYYDGLIFHRVIRDFMIQTGDPTGTGRGGASLSGKEFADEIVPSLHHLRGTLSMANKGPNTNGSQFFIVQNPKGVPYLDGGYSIFGQVFAGQDVVDTIASVQKNANDKPLTDLHMKSVEVFTVAQ